MFYVKIVENTIQEIQFWGLINNHTFKNYFFLNLIDVWQEQSYISEELHASEYILPIEEIDARYCFQEENN